MQVTQIIEDQYALNKTQRATLSCAFFEDDDKKLLKYPYQVAPVTFFVLFKIYFVAMEIVYYLTNVDNNRFATSAIELACSGKFYLKTLSSTNVMLGQKQARMRSNLTSSDITCLQMRACRRSRRWKPW